MKKTAFVLAGLLATAAPAWSAEHETAAEALSLAELTEVFLAMPEGNAEHGAELHQTYWCASCHGPTGVSQSRNYPSVAGQVATYSYKTLLDYREGRRMEGNGRAVAMAASVHGLTDQDLADLAAYYAAQPLAASGAPVELSEAHMTLVRHGDPDRLITPCASCHGVDGEAGIRPETPALAGLSADYLEKTLKAYRSGHRSNDTAKGMRFFAERLTDDEIEALAAYYAGLGD